MADVRKILLIGAGNVGYHLGKSLHASGNRITQVYSRHFERAQKLAEMLGARPADRPETLQTDVDLCLLAVSDDVIHDISEQLPPVSGIICHTSGAVSLESISPKHLHRGVFYPLQTFTYDRNVNMEEVPLFIEGESRDVEIRLQKLAKGISASVQVMNSEKRKKMHVAAVILNNFTNHLLHTAYGLMQEEGIPFELMEPLARETIRKAFELGPEQAQTGPAKRGDVGVQQQHLEILNNDDVRELYSLISSKITKAYTGNR